MLSAIMADYVLRIVYRIIIMQQDCFCVLMLKDSNHCTCKILCREEVHYYIYFWAPYICLIPAKVMFIFLQF